MAWLIALRPRLFDFGFSQAEQEEILWTDGLADFDVGAILGADRDGAVHREFHVAGARGLFAGGGDLFGQVGGRVNTLTDLDVEVGHEHHFENL